MALARVRLAIQRFEANFLCKSLHALTPDLLTCSALYFAQHPSVGEEGMLQMQFVDSTHHLQIAVRYGLRRVVRRRACQLENLELPGDWQVVGAVDHLLALSRPALVSALSKNSPRSIAQSWRVAPSDLAPAPCPMGRQRPAPIVQ